MAKKTPSDASYNAKATAISGNDGKPKKVRDVPPRLQKLAPRVHGLPAPIKVRVVDNLGAPKTSSGVDYGARARNGKGQSNQG